MKGLVVVSHPDEDSLNHAMARKIERTWNERGVQTGFVDLHGIGFDPVLTRKEARGVASEDAVVEAQIDLLQASDLLAVVHPNCWGAPPAMLKGWMDRIFAPGAAYAFEKGKDDGGVPRGLLIGKRALVLNTSNTTGERERTDFGDPLERIWRDCLLGYCGFSRIDRRVFRVVAGSTRVQRERWLAETADAAVALTQD